VVERARSRDDASHASRIEGFEAVFKLNSTQRPDNATRKGKNP